jgi:hypothetical protein
MLRHFLLVAISIGILTGFAEAEPFQYGLPLSAWLGQVNDPNADVRGSAAIYLGYFGPDSPGVTEALLAFLNQKPTAFPVAESLAEWGVVGEKLLLEAIRTRGEPARSAAIRALASRPKLSQDEVVGSVWRSCCDPSVRECLKTHCKGWKKREERPKTRCRPSWRY